MRMMVVFEKGASLRFIGHLDLMRTMQRALRRSGLPIKYSSGFNPHIRLSFAQPLGVGVIGLRELMEVPIEGEVAPDEFMSAMNRVLPELLRVRFCRAVDESFPTLMSLVGGSRYSIRFAEGECENKAVDALQRFMSLKEYVADRRTKSGEAPCDIRQFVVSAEARCENGENVIELVTAQNASGALKPGLWMDCLSEYAGVEPFKRLIYREAILSRDKSGALIPMEELP